jgi:thiol-disulfide isomerase/thioredoxin
MKRIALSLQCLLTVASLGLAGTLWFLMLTQGDDSWLSWRRSFSVLGLYVDLYAFLLLNCVLVPVVVLAVWRLLQLLGRAADREGVRWSNRVLLSMIFGCLVVITLRWQLWEELTGGGAASMPPPPSDERLEYPTLPLPVEEEVFAWEVKDAQGQVINVADLKGKAVFLNIWATWCGYCKYEFPNIQRLYEAYKDDPKVVFLLVTEEDAETVAKWRASEEGKGYNLPFYTTTKIPKRFDPSGYPTTFFIAPNGETVFEHSGFVAWDGEKTKAFLKTLAEQPAE